MSLHFRNSFIPQAVAAFKNTHRICCYQIEERRKIILMQTQIVTNVRGILPYTTSLSQRDKKSSLLKQIEKYDIIVQLFLWCCKTYFFRPIWKNVANVNTKSNPSTSKFPCFPYPLNTKFMDLFLTFVKIVTNRIL